MQINRLFEILYLLLNHGTLTAGEMAQRFEVSRRTIYRDIDALCQAGIPIYTSKGKNGGITLMENFVLNRALLTREEQEEILTALSSLQAVHSPESNTALSKLRAFFGGEEEDWVRIDLSDWSNQRQALLEDLREAVIHRKLLTFDYFNAGGQSSHRTVEPQKLWFKGRSWYLLAFCREKQAGRLFKLSRIKNYTLQEETFLPRPESSAPAVQTPYSPVHLELLIHGSQAYRVYDEFDERQITRQEDGNLRVWADYPLDEWVYSFILSFGDHVQVLSPTYIKEEVRHRLETALKNFI